MSDKFQLSIPQRDGGTASVTVQRGEVLYVLGANGSGKSSLMSNFYKAHNSNATRISAHRQTWFEHNTPNITPRGKQVIEAQILAQDVQGKARYTDWNPASRIDKAFFDLIDAENMKYRKIATLFCEGDTVSAAAEGKTPSPIQAINELMRLSNLPIEISLEEGQKLVARKNGGETYSVAQLSDGERNAFLIAINVLTAKPGTLLLIDEPERHLHRSIISPLLTLLFEKRKDCAFIVSTHEVMLPADSPESSTMLIRDCTFQGENVHTWTIDILKPASAPNEEMKRDILGARRKILFVEGSPRSLDAPLYSLLFPQVSVIPKASCREVEQAVRGLGSAPEMHWIKAWGIVDNDQRSSEGIEQIRQNGIWALPFYSVEALYYHPTVIGWVAERQAEVTGADPTSRVQSAIERAICAVKEQKDHLILSTVLRSTRKMFLNRLPKGEEVKDRIPVCVKVDTCTLFAQEESYFDTLISAQDWEKLLVHYPLRESAAFSYIASEIDLGKRETYQAAVLKLLQDEPESLSFIRQLLHGLYDEIIAA